MGSSESRKVQINSSPIRPSKMTKERGEGGGIEIMKKGAWMGKKLGGGVGGGVVRNV